MREIEFRAWHKIRKKMYIVMNLTKAEQSEGLADSEESEIIGNSHTTPEMVP